MPLRFVSEALGAGVNYDASNQIVALTTGRSAAMAPPVAPPGAIAMTHRHYLRNLEPAYGGTVASTRPTLQGEFSEPVDPNSIHMTLDGRDVTGILVANPEPTDTTTGLIAQLPRPGNRRLATLLKGMSTDIKR